jgi:hypothetical protein
VRDGALDRLVAAATPLRDQTLHAADLGTAFDLLGHGIVAGKRPVSVPRYRRRGALLVAFAAALLVAAAAVGGMYSTHTGFFPAKAGTENDTSEFLRTDAPDFPLWGAKNRCPRREITDLQARR